MSRRHARGNDRRGGARRAQPVPFPIAAGAAAWWDPSRGYALASGKVSSWEDRIGGHVFSQATTGLQPTWAANGFTYATSRLQGASLVAALLSQALPVTVLCKVKPTAPSLTGVAWSATNVATATPWRGHRSASGTDQGLGGTGGTAGTQSWGASDLVLCYQYTGTRMKTWVNDVASVDAALSGIGADCDELTLGSQRFAGGFLNNFSGGIGDHMVFASAISDSVRQAGQTWLASQRPAL